MDEVNKLPVRETVLSFDEISKNISKGYPITCSTCPHLYTSQAKGEPSCGRNECFGPLNGGSFPSYSGGIPRYKLDKICLICGDPSISCQIVTPGQEQRFGFCKKHEGTFDNFVVNPNQPGLVTPLIIPILTK